MSRRPLILIWLGLGLAVLTGLGLGLARWLPGSDGPAQGPARPPTPVEVATAEVGAVPETVDAIGTVRAVEEVELTSEVAGKVVEVAFQEGQRVAEDELLVLLRDAEEQAALVEAEAAADEARALLRRTERLVEDGVRSAEVLDQQRARVATAEARIEAARAALDERAIRAPFAGTVGLRRVSPGALVRPGDPVAVLQTPAVEVRFAVPASLLPRLEPGLEVLISAPALGDEPVPGRVAFVDPRVDRSTRSVMLEAEVFDAPDALRPGLLVEVGLVLEVREAVLVPEEALVVEGSSQYVYRVDDEGIVHRVEVASGARRDGRVAVEGLEAGARVVRTGLQKVQDGARVAPADAADPPRQPSAATES